MINWQECIDAYVEAQRKPYVVPKAGIFRASELSGCVRQCVMSRMGLRHFNAAVLRNFEIGTQLHRFIQEKVGVGFVDRPVQFERQVEIKPSLSLTITGHVDCFDGAIVYDFKSIKGFTYVTHGNISKAYLYQLHVYMHALGVKKAVLVYIDKGTWEVKPLDVNYSEETFNELVQFCEDVDVAVNNYKLNGKLPEKDGCFSCKCEIEEVKV